MFHKDKVPLYQCAFSISLKIGVIPGCKSTTITAVISSTFGPTPSCYQPTGSTPTASDSTVGTLSHVTRQRKIGKVHASYLSASLLFAQIAASSPTHLTNSQIPHCAEQQLPARFTLCHCQSWVQSQSCSGRKEGGPLYGRPICK